MKSILSLAVLLSLSSAFAQQQIIFTMPGAPPPPAALQPKPSTGTADCISAEDYAKISSDISFVSADGSLTNLDLCDASTLTYKTVKALLFLKNLPLIQLKPDAFNQQIMGADLFAFFKERIHTVSFEPDEYYCSVTYSGSTPVFWTVAYVLIGDTTGTMHICKMSNQGTVSDLVPTLVHEARHENGYHHVTCNRGVLQKYDTPDSGGSCDSSYDEQGSYGVGVEYQVDIGRTASLDPALRQSAKAQAMADFFERFNKLPLGLVEGALVKAADGTLSFYDGTKLQNLQTLDKGTILGNRDGSVALYHPKSGQVNFLAPDGQSDPGNGIMATYYSTKVTPAQQGDLIDVIYENNYSCLLFRESLMCLNTDNGVADIPLHAIRPVSFVEMDNSYLLKSGVISIVDDAGYTYSLPLEFDVLDMMSEKDFVKSPKPQSFTHIGEWKSNSHKSLLVTTTGHLQIFDEKTHATSPAPGVGKARFENLLAPYLWSSKLKDL